MTVMKRRGAAVRVALATLTVGFAAALIAVGGKAAKAQDADTGILTYPSHPFSVRAGLYLPRNGTVRDQEGIDWLSYGLGYDISTKGVRLPHTFSVYADYFDVSKTTGPDVFRLRSQSRALGIGLAERYYFAPHTKTFQPFVGAGFGVYDVHAKSNDPGGEFNVYKTSIGGKVLAGVEIREGLFLQGDYNWLPEPKLQDRLNLGGYQIQLGYRF